MTDEQVRILATALARLSHGDVSGPTGLEAHAMAFAKGDQPSISDRLGEIAAAIEHLADALDTIQTTGIRPR